VKWRSVCGGMLLLMGACSGGGGSGGAAGSDTTVGCSGNCAATQPVLTVADVEQVLTQAVFEAQALAARATIAVVDRVGNVLAVFRMGSALQAGVTIASELDAAGLAVVDGGLEGIVLPVTAAPVAIDDQVAIAKAVSGAYLSSEGQAFSTRTASQIVQEHFNPAESLQPGGPLFGVQFSQLACSDLTLAFSGGGPDAGPKRSPLGLAADPGGFPLYKDGAVVGGIGVAADGRYGLDKDITDRDLNVDELIALAGSFGFAAPVDRRADRVTVDGKTLRFSDARIGDLAEDPEQAPPFADFDGVAGDLLATPGYSVAAVAAGVAFETSASGIRADGDVDFPGLDAYVLVDSAALLRFPPSAGTDAALVGGAVLTAAEVRGILQSALRVAQRTRAQIRRPLGSSARVTIAVVDSAGAVLGVVRSQDAPVFSADVSLQKARTAAFFSSPGAADFLRALPNAKYITTTDASVGVAREVVLGDYVDAAQAFLADPNALETGEIAFSDRAGGNLSRPFYPDGLTGRNPGPFSKSPGEWSPFSTGLQLDLSINAILQHVLFTAGVAAADVGAGCVGVDLSDDLGSGVPTVAGPRLANGTQIFPGSVPIYRAGTLVGGIGVSGDGVEQDDLIAFLGLHEAGLSLGGGLGNAPVARRADTLVVQGVRLRYVQCPQAPFLDSSEHDACAGL
jgi:uncharacterized protein GlcG (DUF336 family)